jgi:methyltransferase family protein
MKNLIRRTANALGYDVQSTPVTSPAPEPCIDPIEAFHSQVYQRHNARRLEHLSSLRIPVADKTVLEVGAGIGDHTSYYLDRGCKVTITDARAANLAILHRRYPQETVMPLDMERPPTEGILGSPFNVIHCYGLLYHLNDPQRALAFLAENSSGLLLLETCVSFGSENAINLVPEDGGDPTQSVSGTGCRPTRPWLWEQLHSHFPHVYCPKTQPNHEEFPIDWSATEKYHPPHELIRSIFIASRQELRNPLLIPDLLDLQTRHE